MIIFDSNSSSGNLLTEGVSPIPNTEIQERDIVLHFVKKEKYREAFEVIQAMPFPSPRLMQVQCDTLIMLLDRVEKGQAIRRPDAQKEKDQEAFLVALAIFKSLPTFKQRLFCKDIKKSLVNLNYGMLNTAIDLMKKSPTLFFSTNTGWLNFLVEEFLKRGDYNRALNLINDSTMCPEYLRNFMLLKVLKCSLDERQKFSNKDVRRVSHICPERFITILNMMNRTAERQLFVSYTVKSIAESSIQDAYHILNNTVDQKKFPRQYEDLKIELLGRYRQGSVVDKK